MAEVQRGASRPQQIALSRFQVRQCDLFLLIFITLYSMLRGLNIVLVTSF
jgi:hypothetical protein